MHKKIESSWGFLFCFLVGKLLTLSLAFHTFMMIFKRLYPEDIFITPSEKLYYILLEASLQNDTIKASTLYLHRLVTKDTLVVQKGIYSAAQ